MNRLRNLAAWLVLQHGFSRHISAFVAGLISALALPPTDLFPVMFITLPALVWLMDGVYADARKTFVGSMLMAFAPGFWFGFGYLLAGLWWIGNALLVEAEIFAWALPLAMIVLPAGLAVFYGFATLIARLLWSDGWGRVLALAAGLSVAEFARGTVLTGFPWNALGYTITPFPLLMQTASLIGIYAMTMLAVIIFALPLVVLARTPGQAFRLPMLLAVSLAVLHLGFGIYRLYVEPPAEATGVTVRIMQPSIQQALKMNIGSEARIIETYLETTKLGQAPLEDIDYLVWPESAFPFLLTEEPDVLAAIGDLLPPDTKLITGAMRGEPSAGGDPWDKVYNSVFVINGEGEIEGATDKTHLVPFGEYLPFQAWLEALGLEQVTRLRGGFEAGSRRKVLEQEGMLPFIALVCYEVIFPGQIVDRPAGSGEAPRWMVNVTNDAWFGRTPGPYQHLRQAQLRAVEEGLPVIRAANTGISAVIDHKGRVLAKAGLNEKTAFDAEIPGAVETVFSRFGAMGFALLLFLSIAGSLAFRRR